MDAAATQLPRAEVEGALDTGLLELSIGVGLYLVIAGGAQGILAAVVAMGARDEAPLRPAQACGDGPSARGLSRRVGDASATRRHGHPGATGPRAERGRWLDGVNTQEHRLDTGVAGSST